MAKGEHERPRLTGSVRSPHPAGSARRALTDVYVWKLLRLDLGVPRADAEDIVLGMIDALCACGGE